MYNKFFWLSLILIPIWVAVLIYSPQNQFLHPDIQPKVSNWITYGFPAILAFISLLGLLFSKSRTAMLTVFSKLFFLIVIGGVFAFAWYFTGIFDAFK